MNYTFWDLERMGQSVDFLCVHRLLRTQNLAPLLIQEITRRSYKQGINTAVFTAAFTARAANPAIPPILVTQYFHRLLNPLKLVQCKFAGKPHQMSDRDFEFRYKMPYVQSQHTPCLRKLEKKDYEEVWKLNEDYQHKNYVIQ